LSWGDKIQPLHVPPCIGAVDEIEVESDEPTESSEGSETLGESETPASMDMSEGEEA
jgi:hypothetical protein